MQLSASIAQHAEAPRAVPKKEERKAKKEGKAKLLSEHGPTTDEGDEPRLRQRPEPTN